MENTIHPTKVISIPVAYISIVMAASTVLLLASLHFLSPEFNPSWRMVSEYANGRYGWILSLMFISWAISSWALAFAIYAQLRTMAAKIGLILLITAGIGEALAAVFDINHEPFHDIAGYISIFGFAIAAMLISTYLSHTQPWSAHKKALLWSANLTWISIVVLVVAFAVMIGTFMQSGAKVDPQAQISVLPAGVIGLVGWANRLLIVVYCLWVLMIANLMLKLRENVS